MAGRSQEERGKERKEGRQEGRKSGRKHRAIHLNSKVIYLLNLGQQRNQAGLSRLGPHKAADGHLVLCQHGGVEGNEGLGATGHGPLVWVQESRAAQLVVLLQCGAGLEA